MKATSQPCEQNENAVPRLAAINPYAQAVMRLVFVFRDLDSIESVALQLVLR